MMAPEHHHQQQPSADIHGSAFLRPWPRGGRHLVFRDEPRGEPPSPDAGEPPDDDGFDQIRQKLMAHIRHTANSLNLTIPHPDADVPPPRPTVRRRRSSKPPRRPRDPSPPPPPAAAAGAAAAPARPSRARSAAAAREQRRRFAVALSREEIDEDFYALTGRRAPGRPRRRPPAVRKHLDLLFPGLALSEVTPACYNVPPPRAGARGG